MANELVSALLDGECGAPELRRLLDQMESAPELAQQWGRGCLVREALAGNPVQSHSAVDPDLFCRGIMAQLGEMEAATAPRSAVPTVFTGARMERPARHARVSAQRARRPRALVGWAAAASLTLVALAGSRAWFGNDAAVPAAPALAVATVEPQANDIRPVSSTGNARFGLMPVSTRAYLGGTFESREMHWSHFDADAARAASSSMPRGDHLYLGQGLDNARSYARVADMPVSFQPASDLR